jgi:hypothetical protein
VLRHILKKEMVLNFTFSVASSVVIIIEISEKPLRLNLSNNFLKQAQINTVFVQQ